MDIFRLSTILHSRMYSLLIAQASVHGVLLLSEMPSLAETLARVKEQGNAAVVRLEATAVRSDCDLIPLKPLPQVLRLRLGYYVGAFFAFGSGSG